jgi:hypothetical protein
LADATDDDRAFAVTIRDLTLSSLDSALIAAR